MPWIAAAIGAGGSLLGGALGSNAAGNAADAAARAQQQNLALQRQIFGTQLGTNEPWRATGQGALNQLAQIFGLPYQGYQSAQSIFNSQDPGTPLGAKAILKMLKQGQSIEDIAKLGSFKDQGGLVKKLSKHGVTSDQIAMLQGGPGQFAQQAQMYNQPGQANPAGQSGFQPPAYYDFFQNQGQKNLLGAFGAGGQGVFSGNALKGFSDFNQKYAQQNAINPLMQLAGFGTQANQGNQYAQAQYGNQVGNAMNNLGDARASGIGTQGSIWGNAIGDAANAAARGYYNWKNPYDSQGGGKG